MAFGHGKDGAFKLDNDDGDLIDISQYVTNVDPSFEGETSDVTALGKTARAFIRGLANATLSLEGIFDPLLGTAFAIQGTATATKSWEWHPQGTASGKQKYSGEGFLTSFNVPGGVDEAVTFSLELQVTGDIAVANN